MIYEQTLNETIRLCLRLEHLFHRINVHSDSRMPWQSAFALNNLLELLSVIDRPDLKSKLTKLLSLTVRSLLDIASQPSANKPDNLDQSINYLQTFLDSLQRYSGKIGHDLYNDAFLRLMRTQLFAPGGSCPFSAPEYYLWLQQPDEKRVDNLTAWLAPLRELQSMAQWLLTVIRQMDKPSPVVADKGFYQKVLDTQRVGQMVRLVLENNNDCYPTFSVGPHRLSIYFQTPCFKDGTSRKWEEDFPFHLGYCAI